MTGLKAVQVYDDGSVNPILGGSSCDLHSKDWLQIWFFKSRGVLVLH